MAYLPAVRSTVDSGNSTTAALGAAAVFTGSWEDIEVWNGVSVIISGTAASTAPGTLVMQFSHDGATVARAITVNVADVASASPRTLGTIARYFRVVYTNGGQAQTTFSLQTMLHSSQVNLVSRLDQSLTGMDDVQNVRSIPTGRQPDGDFVNAKADGTAFSNTTPLLATATYNSDWIDTDGFVAIELFISTDQLSSVGGIVVQYTDDVQGATTVRATDNYTFTQNDIDRGYLALSFPTRLDGFRVQFTNGSVDQVSFFIQSDLRTNSSPLRTDQGGTLITGDFQVEVALGNVPNHSNGTKFGAALSIDGADAPVTVWRPADADRRSGAFARKVFATVAQNVWVASTAAGTSQITLILNDASNNLVETTVTLNGTTPVDSGVSALDCNTAFVSGADQTLAGDVWIMRSNNFGGGGAPAGEPSVGSEADVLAFIPQADQRTQQVTYRVPANTTMVVREVHAAMKVGTGQGKSKLKARIKPSGGSWYTIRPYILTDSFTLERPELITLSAGTFLEFFLDEVGTNGSDTTVIFNYDLIVGA